MRSIEEYTFVKIVGKPWSDSLEARKKDPTVQISPILYVYEICGEKYERHEKDHFIDDAIVISGRWPAHQVSYKRIAWLRTWLRENFQHGHDLPTKGIRTLKGCEKLIDKLIELEYRYYEGADRDQVIKDLKTQNKERWKIS